MHASLKVVMGLTAVLAIGGTITAVRSEDKAPAKAPAKTPAVAGTWTGTWGPYLAPKPGNDKSASEADSKKAAYYTALQKALDCKVVMTPNGDYEATFEGECGRPYKYTIKMNGRAAGGSVLFKGTTDLGEKDGGVYDWIGRASDKEFLGFYTSATHTGTFTLVRPK